MSEHIIFRTTEENKRLVRILAARAGYVNTSEWLNALLKREIDKLTPGEIATLLGNGATSPKDRSGRRAKKQVAT